MAGLAGYHCTVFGGEGARGNLTGVVCSERDRLDGGRMQSIARDLGYPDTIFLAPEPNAGGWIADAYSPAESMALCIQGLLGAAAVLRQVAGGLGWIDLMMNGRWHRVHQGSDGTDTDGAVEWLHLPDSDFHRDVVEICEQDISAFCRSKPIRVDVGRRRILFNIGSEEAIASN